MSEVTTVSPPTAEGWHLTVIPVRNPAAAFQSWACSSETQAPGCRTNILCCGRSVGLRVPLTMRVPATGAPPCPCPRPGRSGLAPTVHGARGVEVSHGMPRECQASTEQALQTLGPSGRSKKILFVKTYKQQNKHRAQSCP